MKKGISAIVIVLVCAVGYLFYAQNSQKEDVVYIDVNVLMADYEGMKDAKKVFEEKSKVWQANVDSLIVGFQNELKVYEKERSKMTKKENELQQELLRNKQQQVGNYQQAIQRQSEEEDAKLSGEVVNEVNAYIKEYGKNHHYKIIIGANSSGNVLYAQEGVDITQEVLTGLNAEYVKK